MPTLVLHVLASVVRLVTDVILGGFLLVTALTWVLVAVLSRMSDPEEMA